MGETETQRQHRPGKEASRAAWALAAYDVLTVTAGNYHKTVTYGDLAKQVQDMTGVRTNQLLQHWVGDVLGRVADRCAAEQVPNLSSLCVNSQGSVGAGYADAVARTTGQLPADVDDHAAEARLLCYRHHRANGLPADGGVPALDRALAASRARLRKQALADRAPVVCASCFVQMPATGLCDTCD